MPFQIQGQTLHLPGDGFVDGWTKQDKTLKFSENNLFNYIDGGAELFLEFGFEELLVQNYRKDGHEIGIDIYRMKSPEAALGIYLMKCGHETPITEIGSRNSADTFQFSILKNNYFLMINNFKGKKTLIPVMVKLAQKILDSIPSGLPQDIFVPLPEENLINGSQLLIRGPFSLQSIFTFGKGDILQLRGEIFGLVGEYKDSNGKSCTRIVIPYPNIRSAQDAYEYILSNLDSYLEILENRKNGFIFKDYKNEYGIVLIKNNQIDIKVNLSDTHLWLPLPA